MSLINYEKNGRVSLYYFNFESKSHLNYLNGCEKSLEFFQLNKMLIQLFFVL